MSAMPPIYAFVHIPFSAGTTVRNAILASHSADEVFDCYGWRRTSASIADEIRALSPARRDRVKFLLGHQVWFGIDELFDREVRYFTFLRNPISRTVSAYWKIQRDERNFYHDARPVDDARAVRARSSDLPESRDGHAGARRQWTMGTTSRRVWTRIRRCWLGPEPISIAAGLPDCTRRSRKTSPSCLRRFGLAPVAPANVRPAAQDQERGPASAASHAIVRHNMMDFCLYSTVQIKREREAARLMRTQSS